MTVEQSTESPEFLAQVRANEFLSLAEHFFGPMASPWRYSGVIFRDHPPHLYYAPEESTVQISLSLRAIDDDVQRDFQLAHEICHLLYPSVEHDNPVKPSTTMLNEGISTLFSVIVLSEYYGQETSEMALKGLADNSPKYFNAFQLTSKLLATDKEAVKKLRAIQPMVNKITAADFASAGVHIGDSHISALISICQ